MSKFYVYEFWDIRSNTPFYVGKATGSRCFHTGRNDAVEARIQELHSRHEIRIVLRTKVEQEAFALERQLIAKYGSAVLGTGTLLNIALVQPVCVSEEVQITGKNWKSPWHLARTGGTKEEVEALRMKLLKKAGREIRRKHIYKYSGDWFGYICCLSRL